LNMGSDRMSVGATLPASSSARVAALLVMSTSSVDASTTVSTSCECLSDPPPLAEPFGVIFICAWIEIPSQTWMTFFGQNLSV
jgi:hypothetical protein